MTRVAADADVAARIAELEQQFAAARASASAARGNPVAVVEESDETVLAEQLAVAKRLQQRLFEMGLANPPAPPQFGGCSASAAEAAALTAAVGDALLPTRNMLFVGLNIVAPAVAAFGSAEQQHRFLPELYSGRAVGCQLFSEPGAGSDLAGVSTRARRDGDGWVVSGQKVWTSHAQIADWGEALVRTDSAAPKHAGLSMLMIDMHSPGVTVAPLRQMTGGAAFNEVFLDDVWVPDTDRIGAIGAGWRVATASLSSERGAMGNGDGPLSPRVLNRLGALLDAHDDLGNDEQAVRAVTALAVQRAVMARTADDWPAAIRPVSGSVQKLLLNSALDEVSALLLDRLGAAAVNDLGTTDFDWSEFVLGVPAVHIAGGTDEIQRDLIARRALDMPRPA